MGYPRLAHDLLDALDRNARDENDRRFAQAVRVLTYAVLAAGNWVPAERGTRRRTARKTRRTKTIETEVKEQVKSNF